MSDSAPNDRDEIRREIEKTRADLAATVDALSAKLDVKAQAKVNDPKAAVTDTIAKVEPYRMQLVAAGVAAVTTAAVVVLVRRRSR